MSDFRNIKAPHNTEFREHVLISTLTLYERNGWYCPQLLLFLMGAFKQRDYQTSFCPAHNFFPSAAARNVLAKGFLEKTDAEWLLMIDNDMAPPMNMLNILDTTGQEHDIVVPRMYMWADSPKPLTRLCWRVKGLSKKKEEFKRYRFNKTWNELETTGSGVIFIRRRVFEKMPYPYFQYTFDKNFQSMTSDDVPFVYRARRLGFRAWGHWQYVAGHYHNVDLSLVKGAKQP